MHADDDFNWNYGLAKASVGDFNEAEEALLSINNERYRMDPIYVNWLARWCDAGVEDRDAVGMRASIFCYFKSAFFVPQCSYIMNGKPGLAWEQYLRMETSSDSYNLLQLIANDCYKVLSCCKSTRASTSNNPTTP